MPNTPNYSLPYPLATDPADVPADMQELAVAVDSSLDVVDDRVDVLEPKVATLETASLDYDARLDTIEPKVPAARVAPGANGDVLTTVAGAAAWAAGGGGGGGGRTLIQEIVVAGSVLAAFNFAAIAAAYKHLELVGVVRANGGGTTVEGWLRCNGDATASYANQLLGGSSGAASAAIQSPVNQLVVGRCADGGASPATRASHFRILLPHYTDTVWEKQMLSESVWVTGAARDVNGGVWTKTPPVAITSLTLLLAAGSWAIGSRVALYGLS